MNFSEKISSDLKIIPGFISTIMEKIKQLPLDEGELHAIKLSLQEALVNAIRHGNKLNPGLSVDVMVESSHDSLVLIVADQGSGFDVKNIPDPTNPRQLEKLSGRGIFLIQNNMDEVSFFDAGRKIKMVKFFRKGRAQ